MDVGDVGQRAKDLAFLSAKGFRIPLSFVLGKDAYERFMKKNKLQEKIDQVLSKQATFDKERAEEVSRKIGRLFLEAQFDQKFEEELEDAYESLGFELEQLSIGDNEPKVNLLASPIYCMHRICCREVVFDVGGFRYLLESLKEVWASLYSRDAILYRQKRSLNVPPSIAVIVQTSLPFENSGVIMSSKDPSRIEGEISEGMWKEGKGKAFKVEESGIVVEQGEVDTSKIGYNHSLLEVSKLTRRTRKVLNQDIRLLFSTSKKGATLLCVERKEIPKKAVEAPKAKEEVVKEFISMQSGKEDPPTAAVTQLHQSLAVSIVQSWALIAEVLQKKYKYQRFEEHMKALENGKHPYSQEARRIALLAKRITEGSGAGVDEAFFAVRNSLRFYEANKR